MAFRSFFEIEAYLETLPRKELGSKSSAAA
jgi:hypothetical protein